MAECFFIQTLIANIHIKRKFGKNTRERSRVTEKIQDYLSCAFSNVFQFFTVRSVYPANFI